MPPSDLERRQQELVLRIAEKEREIGRDLELIRQTARRASSTTVAVLAGAGILLGAWITWRAFRAFPRARFVDRAAW